MLKLVPVMDLIVVYKLHSNYLQHIARWDPQTFSTTHARFSQTHLIHYTEIYYDMEDVLLGVNQWSRPNL